MIVGPQTVTAITCRLILEALIDTGAPLDGAKLHLYKDPLTPSKTTLLADLTPADFTGYATSAAIVWGTVLTDTDGSAYAPGGAIEFAATGSTVSNTVYGAYLTDGAGTGLLAILPFDTPVGISGVGSGVVVPLQFRYNGN